MSQKKKRGPAGPKLRASRKFRAQPGVREREALRTRARYEAFAALARKYPAEFMALYAAELRHLGVDVPPTERPCPCGGIIYRKAPVGAWPRRCDDCGAAARQTHRPLPQSCSPESSG